LEQTSHPDKASQPRPIIVEFEPVLAVFLRSMRLAARASVKRTYLPTWK